MSGDEKRDEESPGVAIEVAPQPPERASEKQRELQIALESSPQVISRRSPAQGMAILHSSYSGPLPPPGMLAEYAAIQPDFPERLLAAVEQEGIHRRGLERLQFDELAKERADLAKDRTAQTRIQRLGVWCGLTIGALGLISAVTLGLFGHDVAASIVGGIDITALVAVFVAGTIANRKNGDDTSETKARAS